MTPRIVRIDASALDSPASYKMLVGSVVPRPIAWVTSGRRPGVVNLAPFSSYAWVSSYPPLLGFNIAFRDGQRKDTARNIMEHGDYVVHVVDEAHLEAMHASSEDFPPDVSEVERLGLELLDSDHVGTPRLAAAPVAMECVLREVNALRSAEAEHVIGEVVAWHVREDLLSGGRIDTKLLAPVGRVAGPRYATMGDYIDMVPFRR